MNDAADRDDRVALWNGGVQLCTAWMHYGHPRQIAQQIKSRGTGRSIVFEQLMMGDVFGELASGKLIALGYRIQPTLSDGPVHVPADVFQQVDRTLWQDDRASASGCSYERIRVLRASMIKPAAEPVSRQTSVDRALGHVSKRGGRPSNAGVLAEAIAELDQGPEFRLLEQKEQIARVFHRARTIAPGRFKRPTQPARSSIIDALNAAGLTIASGESEKSKKSK